MIKQNVAWILSELPDGVQLVAAVKARAPEEILEAVESGVKILGENYVQEAERAYEVVGNRAKWHFIGHLQKNKVKKAVKLFDMIETVDSLELAREIITNIILAIASSLKGVKRVRSLDIFLRRK